nr:MAG TPA: hypothetical protein [Caudoviricetes sp.]DAW65915.1 MAG TPA: hypothetical protein [Bacteriophage sp.]
MSAETVFQYISYQFCFVVSSTRHERSKSC